MRAWNHQHVPMKERSKIEERDRILGRSNHLGRTLTGRDRTEDTLGHDAIVGELERRSPVSPSELGLAFHPSGQPANGGLRVQSVPRASARGQIHFAKIPGNFPRFWSPILSCTIHLFR